MSSLDADTNANSAMLTKDVYSKFVNKDASQKHYINIGRIFMVSLVAITVFASFWKWGLVAIMIGVTASMITQLLPAVLAVTVPTGLRITKAGIVSGIITGFLLL